MPRMMRASNEEEHQHHQHHCRHHRKPATASPVNAYLGLRYYWNKINTDKTVFTCPYCTKSLTSKTFEYHVSHNHNDLDLDPRHCCVWCNGTVSWRGRNKAKHVPHLVSCWRSFLAALTLLPSSSSSATSSPSTSAAFHTAHQDMDPLQLLQPPPPPASPPPPPPPLPSSSNMDDDDDPLLRPPSVQYVWNLPDRASDVIWPQPVKSDLLIFEDDAALRPAVSAVQKFLDFTTHHSSHRHTSTCNSSTITTTTTATTSSFSGTIASSSTSSTRFSSCFSSFIRSTSALHADTDHAPHSRCLPLDWFHIIVAVQVYQLFLDMMDRCKGAFNTLPYSCWCMVKMDGSCHRHLIVVTNNPSAFLQNVLQLLRQQQQQQPEFVPSAICVVRVDTALNLVDTLGNLSDRRRTRTGWCPFPSGGRIRAYYALKKLPVDFRLALLMQWNNGVLQDDQYKELRPRDKGKRLTDLKLRAVTYISRDHFTPCHYPTGYMLHLIWGEKVYFKRVLSDCMLTQPSNALTPAALIRYPVPAAAATAAAAITSPTTTKLVKLKNFPFRVRMPNDSNRW